MKVRVTRHGRPGPDDESYARDLGEDLAQTLSTLERSPRMLDVALSEALTHVQARLAVNPDASELGTWEAVVTAMQVSSALFATAATSEGTVPCRIADRTLAIPATGPVSSTHAGNWLTAFWLAIVCREQARMTQLSQIPVDMLRVATMEFDDYLYHWVEALQTYWLEQPGLVEGLITTIEATYPENVRVADQELLEKILYPPINLFHRFLRKDHGGFNEALAETLKQHRAYYTASPERERSIEGYLALGPLAMTCLAYDAGFPVEVESDYIPSELISRAWLGEFPT